MWEVTPSLVIICSCSTLGVFAVVGYLLRELHRVWMSNFYRRPVSSVNQAIRLLGYLALAAVTIVVSSVTLALALTAISMLFI